MEAVMSTELLTPGQASEVVGLSAKTLAHYRVSGEGPHFYKIGRFVRYKRCDLDTWIEDRRFLSTSQVSA